MEKKPQSKNKMRSIANPPLGQQMPFKEKPREKPKKAINNSNIKKFFS